MDPSVDVFDLERGAGERKALLIQHEPAYGAHVGLGEERRSGEQGQSYGSREISNAHIPPSKRTTRRPMASEARMAISAPCAGDGIWTMPAVETLQLEEMAALRHATASVNR